MPESSINVVPRGTDLRPYKDKAIDLQAEGNQVKMWKQRIRRAATLLNLRERREEAEEGDRYLNLTKVVKNGKKVYNQYARPLLEQSHRQVLPSIPAPRVEARNSRSELFEAQARQLVDLNFNSPYADVILNCRRLQWDIDRAGVAFAATEWEVDYEPAEPAQTMDPGQQAEEVQVALNENAGIARAKISEDDVDYIHAMVHSQAASQLEPDDESEDAFRLHIEEHIARMSIIRRERPKLRRIPWYRFYYDVDRPWEKRAWEAEESSERIGDLLKLGCKNINEQNIKLEIKPGEDRDVAFEDMTVQVLKIHDRRHGKFYIIPADETEGGRFLLKRDWVYGPMDTVVRIELRPWKPEDGYGYSTIHDAIPTLERLADIDFHIDRHIETHSDYQLWVGKGAMTPEAKAGMNDPNRRVVEMPMEALMSAKEKKPPELPTANLVQWQRLMNNLRHVFGLDVQDTGAEHAHQISATESARRGVSADDRRQDAQEKWGEFLSLVAKNFLSLYRKFATMQVRVRILGPEGAVYDQIDPTDIPEELDIYLDVQGESDQARLEEQMAFEKYAAFLLQLALPTDLQKLADAYGHRLGIRRPEQFRLPLPEGPEFADQMQQQPGASGMGGAQQLGGFVGAKVQGQKEEGFAPEPKALAGAA